MAIENGQPLQEESDIPSRLKGRIKIPKLKTEQKVMWRQDRSNVKPRLPPEALSSRGRKSKIEKSKALQDESESKSLTEQFQGLRRPGAIGNGDGDKNKLDPHLQKKSALRKRQMQLLEELKKNISMMIKLFSQNILK